MKPTLYLETTIVSYLTGLPSHNLVVAAHQQVTRDWWDTRLVFELYVSQFVLDEAGAGDAEAAKRRLVRGAAMNDGLVITFSDGC